MSTTYQLVNRNIVSFIEPIRKSIKKHGLMCKFVIFKAIITAGLQTEHDITDQNKVGLNL